MEEAAGTQNIKYSLSGPQIFFSGKEVSEMSNEFRPWFYRGGAEAPKAENHGREGQDWDKWLIP